MSSFRKNIGIGLMCFNFVLWCVLWANLIFNSTYFRGGDELPDDRYTMLVVLHRAASPAIYASGNWSYRGVFLTDFPSYLEHFSYYCRALNGRGNHAFASSVASKGRFCAMA